MAAPVGRASEPKMRGKCECKEITLAKILTDGTHHDLGCPMYRRVTLQQMVDEALDKLTPREREILDKRFGKLSPKLREFADRQKQTKKDV